MYVYMYTLCSICAGLSLYMMYRIHSELFFMGCRLGIFLDMYVLSISLTETPGTSRKKKTDVPF